jgi:flagellar hook-length control protein FliK
MTIAIVPTLVKLPIRATPAEGAANGAAATPTADISADFASILLGLPVAVGKSVPEQEATASGEAVMAESTIAAGDPALLTPFSPPSLNQPGSSQGAVGQEFEASRQTRPDPLMTATSSRIVREPRQEPLKIEGAAGDRQQQSPSGASAADDQPAKFAVAAFTAPPAERIVPNRPEAGSPTSVLNTLPSAPTPVSGAVSHDIPHHLQTALRDPAWASEFGQKLLWFASNEKQLAQLTLHPPQLGSIEITRGIDNSGPEAGSPANPLNTLPSAPTPANGAVSHDIPHHLQTALRDPAWASEFGQKLLWFASNEKQLAQLTLHPPQLGSIEITLNLDKDSAKAIISSRVQR